jgi:hypothetical protein
MRLNAENLTYLSDIISQKFDITRDVIDLFVKTRTKNRIKCLNHNLRVAGSIKAKLCILYKNMGNFHAKTYNAIYIFPYEHYLDLSNKYLYNKMWVTLSLNLLCSNMKQRFYPSYDVTSVQGRPDPSG